MKKGDKKYLKKKAEYNMHKRWYIKGWYFDETKTCYKHINIYQTATKMHKQKANKRVRKNLKNIDITIPNKSNIYRKMYDIKWNVI